MKSNAMHCVEAVKGQSCERCGRKFEDKQLVFFDTKEDRLICLEGCFKTLPKNYKPTLSLWVKSSSTPAKPSKAKMTVIKNTGAEELDDVMGRKLANDINRIANR